MEADNPGSAQPQLIQWDLIDATKMNDTTTLQVVWGEKATLARFCFKQGTHVPIHRHESEQHTFLLKGKMEMRVRNRIMRLSEGDVLIIPSYIEHEGWFLEDSIVVDFFSPVRTDWARGGYAYLQGDSDAHGS